MANGVTNVGSGGEGQLLPHSKLKTIGVSSTDNHIVFDVFYNTECRYSPIRPVFQMKESLDLLSSDPATLNIALAHACKAISRLAGRQSCPEEMYYINRTIAIINKRIENSRHKSIPLQTVLAVASLTSYEVSRQFSPLPSLIHTN